MLHNHVQNGKIHIFHKHFLNMNISFIMPFEILIFFVYVGKTYFEGSVSQNFDIGLSFCFIVCRRWNFAKNEKKSQKLPVFCHKIKTRT